MATRKELIAAGEPYPGAVAAGGSWDIGVTTTTGMTTQANGYAIKATNTVVTTSGASGNAMLLPVLDQGDWIQVANYTGNALAIFPPVGYAIHQLGQNASYSLAANKTGNFTYVTDPNKPLPTGISYQSVLAIQG